MSKCCMCGVELDDYLEGIHTFEDGQRAHRLCAELPHVKPGERRAAADRSSRQRSNDAPSTATNPALIRKET